MYRDVMDRKYAFLVVFFGVVLMSYAFLYAIDFYPQAPKAAAHDAATTTAETAPVPATSQPQNMFQVTKPTVDQYPTKIIFDSLNKTVSVLNPTSTDSTILDDALLQGAVRYPTSANLADPGNMLIFGHSSYLPNVINKHYQTFNGIQNLTWGDTIRVQTSDMEYVYRVDRVYKAKAADVVVPPSTGIAKLTLATCNVFESKQDRFVVEASLVSSHALMGTNP